MSELSTVSFLQDCKYLFFCHYILTEQKNNVSLDLCKIQWLFNTCAHFCAAQQTSILQFVKFSSGARNSFATLPHRCVLCVVLCWWWHESKIVPHYIQSRVPAVSQLHHLHIYSKVPKRSAALASPRLSLPTMDCVALIVYRDGTGPLCHGCIVPQRRIPAVIPSHRREPTFWIRIQNTAIYQVSLRCSVVKIRVLSL